MVDPETVSYLALDFDGVVADSINECLVTAHSAYSRYQGADRSPVGLEFLSADLVDRFRDMRPLIRRGEDYVFLMQAIEEQKALKNQQQFDHYLGTNADRREPYRRLFYAERTRLQESNPEFWLVLNPLYPGMARFLTRLLDPASVFIVTTKDLRSVRLILDQNGIPIPDENLFQTTRSHRKPAILKAIAEGRGIVQSTLYFIDDHVATVLEVRRDSNAGCACAAWGYNTPNQLEFLQAEGVEALSLEMFFARFEELARPSLQSSAARPNTP